MSGSACIGSRNSKWNPSFDTLPSEVKIIILSYVPPKDLILHGRVVNKEWLEYIDKPVCREILRNTGPYKSFRTMVDIIDVPHHVLYTIFFKDPFGKNLFKGNCGQNSQASSEEREADSSWQIEEKPIGSDPLPDSEDFEGCKSCFVSSYRTAKKSQIVDLYSEGIVAKIIVEQHPQIIISDWYAGRFDCSSSYKMTVLLRDESDNCLVKWVINRTTAGNGETDWKKVTLVLNDYSPNLRSIEIIQEGKDRKFWAGNYGVKVAGTTLKVHLKPVQVEASHDWVKERPRAGVMMSFMAFPSTCEP